MLIVTTGIECPMRFVIPSKLGVILIDFIRLIQNEGSTGLIMDDGLMTACPAHSGEQEERRLARINRQALIG